MTTVIASLITFVATYYFARASKVTVWYSIATTALGTDGSLQDLVPGISITVGEEDVPALTVHEVQILPGSGTHVDKGTLAIDFDRPTRMYGEVLAFAPTSAHQIECSGVAVGDGKLFAEDTRFSGVACDLSPISDGQTFTIRLACDQRSPPRIALPAERVLLRDVAAAERELAEAKEQLLLVSTGGVVVMGLLFLFSAFVNRKQLAVLAAELKIAMRDQGRLLEGMATLKEATEKPTTGRLEPPKPDAREDSETQKGA